MKFVISIRIESLFCKSVGDVQPQVRIIWLYIFRSFFKLQPTDETFHKLMFWLRKMGREVLLLSKPCNCASRSARENGRNSDPGSWSGTTLGPRNASKEYQRYKCFHFAVSTRITLSELVRMLQVATGITRKTCGTAN